MDNVHRVLKHSKNLASASSNQLYKELSTFIKQKLLKDLPDFIELTSTISVSIHVEFKQH